MSGLEVVEVLFSKTLKSSDYFRLEAEYFNAKTVINSLTGNDVYVSLDYGTSDSLNEVNNGYPTLRLNEIINMFIHTPAKWCDSLSKIEYDILRLKKNDVVICRTNGNPNLVGKCAVIMTDTDYAFASYCFRVRTNSKINACVLVAYLSSKYGRMEIDKHSIKGNQTNFSPAKFKDISIPCFETCFQNKINDVFENAYVLKEEANTFYTSAETLLLSALGMDNFTLSNEPVAIKSLSESFGANGRLDAEYYQKKYKEIENALNTNNMVKDLCVVDDGVFVPKSGDYKYIELANIGTSGNITSCTVAPFDELPSRARRLVKSGQVIVSSIEGSLSSCALITEEYNGAICSTGFYIIESSVINPETLLILFKSEPIQQLMKKRCSGTILTAISKNALDTMPFPNIDDKTQIKITNLIQNSFELRHQSEKLLETAKQAVEIAIELGEDEAMEWIKRVGIK